MPNYAKSYTQVEAIKPFSALAGSQGWPKHKTSLRNLKIYEGDTIGIDLEWNVTTGKPYLASIANQRGFLASISFDQAALAIKEIYKRPDITIVGHNVLSADYPVLAKELNLPLLPKGNTVDSLLMFFLMNQHLCQGNKTEVEERLDFTRGPGKLNLGSMVVTYSLMSNYKKCRGSMCGGPCPTHNEPWYNALDAFAPIECVEEMFAEARGYGMPIDALLEHYNSVQFNLNEMSKRGIPVDQEAAQELDAEIQAEKEKIFPFKDEPQFGKSGKRLKNDLRVFYYGFNPASSAQIKGWFQSIGYPIRSAKPGDIEEARRKVERGADHDKELNLSIVDKLLEYKSVGRGLKAWFSDELIKDGKIWPEWSSYGGAFGRPTTSHPNVQNFPKRGGLISQARRVLIAPEGYVYGRADAAQGELRVMVAKGGMDPNDLGDDAFTYMLKPVVDVFLKIARESATYRELTKSLIRKGKTKDAAELKAAREALKQTVYAAMYGEGIRLLNPDACQDFTHKVYKELNMGTLRLHKGWTYCGYQIGVDGKHLSRRLFDDETPTHQKQALDIQAHVYKTFPAIIRALMKISEEAQTKGRVITLAGTIFKLIKSERDNFKTAMAANGQNGLAIYMTEALNILCEAGFYPTMYIHDEMGFLFPRSWVENDYKKIREVLALLSHESKLIPGFKCPFEPLVGDNYLQLNPI